MKVLQIGMISAASIGLIIACTLLISSNVYKQSDSRKSNTTEQNQNSYSKSSEDANTELVKLEKRRERWQNADKCLKAFVAINGRIEELCSSVPDIHRLVKEVGFVNTVPIIEAHLKSIAHYEKQLKEEIIDKLPQDEPMTISSHMQLADAGLENSKYQLDMWLTKSKTCIYQGQLREVNYEECKAQVDGEYETYKRNEELRKSEIENALNYFEQNYRKDP